jgi:hypothetical protein
MKHLCANCKKTFCTCDANKIKFGIDIDPALQGAEADAVVECDAYDYRISLSDSEQILAFELLNKFARGGK